MAWNPNIPTVTNRVQDDLDAIRENFQHLDQLAERVDELQTVSELAPIAGELQAVSELAPYIQAILGSRIVDHNLDVANPPNGYYVRWDNGLQICWHLLEGTNTDPENAGWHVQEGFVEWTIPASFVDELLVLALASSSGWHPSMLTSVLDTDTATIRRDPTQPRQIIPYRVLVYQDGSIYVRAFAVGRWK